MSRSLKKGPYTDEKLMKKVTIAKESGKLSPIKTWARVSTITPEMVGMKFLVYNGKKHEEVLVSESMIGHRLGEFSPTRKFKGHAKKGKLSQVYGSSGRFE
ncbi:MAG: 30S ribosomal protein S19, small subunit ribosomal protein S19 [candidate division WS6 bacterium GW2011_GWC1_36_11]|uniref:Small ribosomal subunit protein uS19 n=3 Tax=Candidatus Dojkabacteria TaxID=74243 RepID=A0A0G0DIE4_9BACT|nr:MAG: 30S ribosomal protein S19, small subunit ribosomal protein S19 [candidate division WS6 bacterium GW2011_GWC1_36_11]KKQ04259.1 MAG: Ribosomal protein S19 [candidate division WS6 bacterium GW2011_WS6_36_26]KKQ11152.1 MAG: Ribosomal protein S19 [candidate division WS6 bacterium GW2011_GWE1_36_69]KKQ11622.1 MAG: Ribosomal protein S19 [candidate division WS6 bacterium GW2011_GWC2_36_7]KKQ16230.1 MAG: Ribosomal protein S19 [candidate division WS6 bacterium GW2011_GWF1_36_8]HAM37482.1 30S rib